MILILTKLFLKALTCGMKATLIALLAVAGSSCMQNKPLSTVPKLDVNLYAGLWYEAARFPHRFEKNLQCVTARYTVRPDGKITVQNRGKKSNGSWSEIQGKAFVPNVQDPGKLKVQFFWPFRAPYWVLKLDTQYRYALVGAPGREGYGIRHQQGGTGAAGLRLDLLVLFKKLPDCGQFAAPITKSVARGRIEVEDDRQFRFFLFQHIGKLLGLR